MAKTLPRASFVSNVYKFIGLFVIFRGLACGEIVQFGHYLDVQQNNNVHVIETIPNVDIETCVESCKNAVTCKHVNFRRTAHLCIQLGVKTVLTSTEEGVVTRPGYVYGNNAVWLEQNTPPSITGCGPPPPVYLTESSGNMYSIGSKVQLTCTNNATITGQITCDSTGAWTGTELMCITECGPIPTVQNSEQTGTSLEVGSQVTFTCPAPYVDRSETITCLQNGTWSRTNISLQCIPDECLDPDSVNVYGTSCYVYVSTINPWDAAKTNCESLGGYLAIISDVTEMNNIRTYIETTPGYMSKDDSHRIYIGLTDSDNEGVFKWLNNEVATYTNFASGEPNGGAYENCFMFTSWARHWYDMKCSRILGSLCEFDM